jgi:crossover junction endodeoxyribonuclease RuvC
VAAQSEGTLIEPNNLSELSVIGIDPGFSGGIAVINSSTTAVFEMPTIAGPKKKKGKRDTQKMIDGGALWRIFCKYQPRLIIIEQVGSMPGQGVSSTFMFGKAYGAALGLSLATSAHVVTVVPAKWKRAYGLIGKSKKASIILARELYPDLGVELRRVTKDDGKAEALLIARYGLLNLHSRT